MTELPGRVDPVWLLARLWEGRVTGRVQPAGWRRMVLVVQMCELAARTREKHRRVSGTVRLGTHELAERLAVIEGAGACPDHTSARRALELAAEAGAARIRVVEDAEGQPRATDVQLLPVGEPSAAALTWATARLARWAKERGRKWLAPLRLLAARRAGGARADRIASFGSESAPPFGGASRHQTPERCVKPRSVRGQRPSARAHAPATPPPPWPRLEVANPRIENARAVLSGPVSVEVAERVQRDALHVEGGRALPALTVLRAAIALRLGGPDRAFRIELGGLSTEHVERLERDAVAWERWRDHAPAELRELSAAGVLLRLADQVAGSYEGRPHPDWLTQRERDGAEAIALLSLLARRLRTIVADLRAQQHRERDFHRLAAQATAWPAWLKLNGDGVPVSIGPHGRYLAVHCLPSRTELASPETRRVLRAAYVAQHSAPPTHAELRASDGSYALVPIHRRPTTPLADDLQDGRGPGRPWIRRGPWKRR